MELLARNKVEDFGRWQLVFDAQTDAAESAGLNLLRMWRSGDDPNNVFFLFAVEDRSRAEAYMSAPEAASVGAEAGVIDGDYHFLTAVPIA